jgi:hypothetical protein
MVSNLETALQQRGRAVDGLISIGLALAALILYLATLAPTVLEADGGEFQFVPWLPGIAHPTGYPLYILLGWLWTHLLPVGEVAWRMNLFSAVVAAAAVGVTYGVARQLLNRTYPDTPLAGRIIAAALAATTFAVTPTFWSQALMAEVYALHALFVVVILGLALAYQDSWAKINHSQAQSKEISRFARNDITQMFAHNNIIGRLLALAIGLSLTHHRTIVLLLPAVMLFLWRTPGHRGRRWLSYAGWLVVPLLLYLYLPLIAPFTPYTTLQLSHQNILTLYDNTFSGFWKHVLGTVFTGELKPGAAGPERLVLAWDLLRQQVGWVGLVLAAMGVITLWTRRQRDLLLLTGLSWAAVVTFNLIYFIGDVFVLFIPAWLIACLWLGLGSLGLAHWLAQTFVRGKTGSTGTSLTFKPLEQRLSNQISALISIVLVTIGLALPLTLLVTGYDRLNQKDNVAARERWLALLAEPIPAGAVLLSNDRNEIMPLWYYQYVEGRRPDLSGLFPLIVTNPGYANIGQVLDQALASGRPVYLIKPMDGLQLKADLTPVGKLYQAASYQAALANPLHITLPEITVPSLRGTITETVSLIGYDLTPASLRPDSQLTITVYWQARQPLSIDYTSYVHLVDSHGQGITQNDHQPGGDFYPSHLWQVGEILRDRHQLTIPAHLSPGVYRLRIGMYYQPQPGVIIGMGQGVEVGSLTAP